MPALHTNIQQKKQNDRFGLAVEKALHAYQRRTLWGPEDYEEDTNPTVDVFTMTAGAAALESALPFTVHVVGEGYAGVPYDHTELAPAVGGDGLATCFENVEVCLSIHMTALLVVFLA